MLTIKPYIIRLFIFLMSFYLINKFLLRPFILETDLANFLQLFTLSVPNFIEAVMGSLVVTGNLLLIQQRLGWLSTLREQSIQAIAISFTSVYVITQEYKIHNLGGQNFFDPNDVIASIIGLVFIFVVLRKYGFNQEDSN